ncbi:MAG: hypothetical protein V4726_20225 [Verrucomicrobiota bacterium]
MDQKTPPSGKSYSEVMNEWAAQQAFVKSSRSRLLHPPYDAHPVAKIIGYLGRLVALLAVPAGIYIYLVMKWAGSPEFNTMVARGLATTLNAGNVKPTGATWQISGQLAMPALEAAGAPGAFYEKFQAETVTTRVPVPMFIRREWVLPRVSISSLDLFLRSGGAGTVPIYEMKEEDLNMEPFMRDQTSPPAARPSKKTGALRAKPQPGGRLTAGYGIDPDFSSLRIDAVQIAELTLNWGGSAAAAGSLKKTQAEFSRTVEGWTLNATGGRFEQGWLNQWQIQKTEVKLSASKAVIGETVLKRAGEGTGKFSGEIILGDVPEVQGHLRVDALPLQDLVIPVFANLFNAEVSGDLTLTGSTNRSTGIQTEGIFQIASGRFSPLDILNALQRITGETQFGSLPMKGGKFTLKTGGSESSSGVVVEVPSFEIVSHSARLRGHLRYERTRPLGTQLDTPATAEKEILSGLVQLGIPRDLAAKFKPEVAKKYLVAGEDGWSWIDIRLDGPPHGDPTSAIASDMVLMSAGPDQ